QTSSLFQNRRRHTTSKRYWSSDVCSSDLLVTEATRSAERQREKEVIKRRLATLVDANPAVREHVEANVRACNGTPGDPHSFDRRSAERRVGREGRCLRSRVE